MALGVLMLTISCGGGSERLTELERVKAGALQVLLLSDHEALKHGKDSFVLEFRTGPGGALVDVGAVKATANMPMPGMPMFAAIDVSARTWPDATRRWRILDGWAMAAAVGWDGPAGRWSINFSGSVHVGSSLIHRELRPD
jgi:hypothetical protein